MPGCVSVSLQHENPLAHNSGCTCLAPGCVLTKTESTIPSRFCHVGRNGTVVPSAGDACRLCIGPVANPCANDEVLLLLSSISNDIEAQLMGSDDQSLGFSC